MITYAIIPAAGKGVRLGAAEPKQFFKVNNRELICYTLDVFEKSDLVSEVIIPASINYFEVLHALIKRENYKKKIIIVEGGAERQDSVYTALNSISAKNDDLIVVHDAARPLLPLSILNKSILHAQKFGSALVALQARDTILIATEKVEQYLDRTKVFSVQTPQIFRYKDLIDSFTIANNTGFIGTDESGLIFNAGIRIEIVEGSALNFKITTAEDFKLFENIVFGNTLNTSNK